MAATGGSISVSSFSSPSSSTFSGRAKLLNMLLHTHSLELIHIKTCKRMNVACLAAQESATGVAAAERKEKKESDEGKGKAKAPAKAVAEMMEEDVIPSLKAILESQDDISDLDLSFRDNKLEGCFVKKGNPYSFWAFFPNGLTGPKGFSLSSYGNGASTVEPFLIDEKKITAKHVVFWVEKRLAAQGIIPVWKEE